MCTANRQLCSSGERNGAQKKTKVSFGKTMMQTLELLQLAKRHVLQQSDIKQYKIKSIASVVIELRLR